MLIKPCCIETYECVDMLMILFISVSLLVYYNKHSDDYINREFDRRLGKVERNSSLQPSDPRSARHNL